MRKYHSIVKIIQNIKKDFEPLSKENKDYLKIQLFKLKYLINKEKQIIEISNKSTGNKNVKISFLDKLKSAVNIKELEKQIKIFEKKRNCKKIISNVNSVVGGIPICNLISSTVNGLLAADSLLSINKGYREFKENTGHLIKNQWTSITEKLILNKENTCLSSLDSSLNIDEINNEMENISLKSDNKEYFSCFK